MTQLIDLVDHGVTEGGALESTFLFLQLLEIQGIGFEVLDVQIEANLGFKEVNLLVVIQFGYVVAILCQLGRHHPFGWHGGYLATLIHM